MSELKEIGGEPKYISSGKACAILGLHNKTLRLYAKAGKIDYIVTEGGKYRFNVADYLARKSHRATQK